MGRGFRAESVSALIRKSAAPLVALFAICGAFPSPVVATHETDHRFTVEGFVCGPDRQPLLDEKVIVKDTRASVTEKTYTDGDGYYKAVLHLHDDNVGDPLEITVGDAKQRAKVTFDPKDRSTERIIRIDFGEGCDELVAGPPHLVYYGAAAVGVSIAAYLSFQLLRRRQKAARRKGKRKDR